MRTSSILEHAKVVRAKVRMSHCHLFHVIEGKTFFALVSVDETHDYFYAGEYSKNKLSKKITEFRNQLIKLQLDSLPELPLEIEPRFIVSSLYFHTLGQKLRNHFNIEFKKFRLNNQIAFV